uniref:hypothetical protein n=1 Tax=Paraburkholderia terrae TaxID=311230 RepID=UPI00296AED36
LEDAAYYLAAGSQSVRHSVRRAVHERHELRSFNRPQHTKFLIGPSGKKKCWRCEPLSFAYFSLRRQRKVGAAPHRGDA